jgi:hypothetical protein
MNPRLLMLLLVSLLITTGALADGLRDPMRPAGSSPPAAPRMLSVQTLRLEGVIGGDRRVAIINGQLVGAGDSIAGVRIVEVMANGVRFERAGKITTLTLPVPPVDAGVRVARSEEK